MSGSKVLLPIASERDYVKNLYYFTFVVVGNGAERCNCTEHELMY